MRLERQNRELGSGGGARVEIRLGSDTDDKKSEKAGSPPDKKPSNPFPMQYSVDTFHQNKVEAQRDSIIEGSLTSLFSELDTQCTMLLNDKLRNHILPNVDGLTDGVNDILEKISPEKQITIRSLIGGLKYSVDKVVREEKAEEIAKLLDESS